MPIDKTTALAQIDAVTARRKQLGQNWVPENVQEMITLCCAAIQRLAPPGSTYLSDMASVLKDTQKSISRSRDEEVEIRLRGILSALRADYENALIVEPQKSDIPAFLQIEKLLIRFHRVAQQLKKRHGNRYSLWITDEYDVQDLLHALLRIDFDDIRPEEWARGSGTCLIVLRDHAGEQDVQSVGRKRELLEVAPRISRG